MALERQKTFTSSVAKTIDTEIEKFLHEEEIDPAAIQIMVDNGNGIKTATLTYAERSALKEAYEKQNRKYSESDAVTYCHVKDIIVPFSEDLDAEVNKLLEDEDVSPLSIARYFTAANKGAFIFYISLSEQKTKMEEKQKEVEKAKEELANKLAKEAVKDVNIDETNDAVEKYSQVTIDDVLATEKTEKEENKEEAPKTENHKDQKKKKFFNK